MSLLILHFQCVCESNYLGPQCGVPGIIQNATVDGAQVPWSTYSLRSRPRRVISAFPFNHEFDLLEARLHDLHHVVDVFIIQESNFTNAGSENPLRLQQQLVKLPANIRDKILLIERTIPPADGFSDGKKADADMRRHLGQEGLRRLSDIRLDDIYVYNDSDEIPRAELLLFLKLYDGFPHQLSLNLIWSIYGFFWQVDPEYGGGIRFDNAIMTIQFFRDFYQYDASKVRSDEFAKNKEMMEKYKAVNQSVTPLKVSRAGWHCSWCFTPEVSLSSGKQILLFWCLGYPQEAGGCSILRLAPVWRLSGEDRSKIH